METCKISRGNPYRNDVDSPRRFWQKTQKTKIPLSGRSMKIDSPLRGNKWHILLYGQLRERAKWIESSTVIDYPSGQDGAILPARDYPLCPARNFFFQKPYNKSFVDQACSVKMAGYWLVLFCEFMGLESVHKHAKTELGQYPAILTSHFVNNPYISCHFSF